MFTDLSNLGRIAFDEVHYVVKSWKSFRYVQEIEIRAISKSVSHLLSSPIPETLCGVQFSSYIIKR